MSGMPDMTATAFPHNGISAHRGTGSGRTRRQEGAGGGGVRFEH
ncbi:hypothetical protein ABZY02_16865 [Streptomyces sp. NPDC006649]